MTVSFQKICTLLLVSNSIIASAKILNFYPQSCKIKSYELKGCSINEFPNGTQHLHCIAGTDGISIKNAMGDKVMELTGTGGGCTRLDFYDNQKSFHTDTICANENFENFKNDKFLIYFGHTGDYNLELPVCE